MVRAVIVSDMLRGFLEEGYPLYCGSEARGIIPNVQKLLDRELKRGSRIFYLCDHHVPNDPEFKMFPPHCVEGTEEAELIPELSQYPGDIIPKKTFSSFYNTPLDKRLKAIRPKTIVVCGVTTHICVLQVVIDGRNRGYEVEVPVDCVASFDKKAHFFALDYMEKVLGARLIKPAAKVRSPRFEIPDSWLNGETADVYFPRTVEILRKEGINPVATMEVFPRRAGILCGIEEVKALLAEVLPKDNREVWALSQGEPFEKKEVVLRIKAPYQSYGTYETAYLGILSHCSGWATAARECVDAAQSIPVISFGARHVHPSVVGIMEYSAMVGGCAGCASTAGAKLTGIKPTGTIPHALIIILGSTAKASIAFHKHMPPEVPRIALVDTFEDEVRESVTVAKALRGKLQGVRLDTPSERGRVTADLVKEVRAWLDLEGFKDVRIVASGGLDPERIRYFIDEGAPVDIFAVGSYISDAKPIDFTADLHEVEGKPIAKRGRMPGVTPNPRLKRVM
ncbi:MAG: nicotinate phosphoribosyltransferase [Dehalococcoidia bacterium]|nr:nicotinate phosphoribosyltransferase [Dehalococcoidia bacterium]